MPNWRREWLAHSKIAPSLVWELRGSAKERLKTFQAVNSHGEPGAGRIFITNYEGLQMEDLYEAFRSWQPEAIALDEIHRLKDRSTKRAKRVAKLCDPGTPKDPLPRPLVYGLSGSPVLNQEMDIFNQMKLIDGGAAFGTSFMEFRARYFIDKNAGMNKLKYFPKWQVIPGAQQEISKRLEKSAMRVLKKDCMDLPPLVRETVFVEMDDNQKKIYKEMLRDFVTFFKKDGEEHVSAATLALTKGLRLMQIASGYVKTVEGVEVSVTGEKNPKQEALRDLLEELTPHSKVLVWAVWKENYRQIREVLEELKIKFVEVHGDVSDKQKHINVDNFSTDPDTRVLLGHPGSGGIGVSLTAASYSIFYSRTFSLEQDVQAEARNHRGGSEIHEKITRIDLITRDSIEEQICEALARKQAIGASVLKDITISITRNGN